ncbi:MAG TPA: sugar ABC transporter substrate-binding protein [Dongiaceae bacterium]|nr:sugar ABC transporter substrate-binding protein [Dongiaceae bacterium]
MISRIQSLATAAGLAVLTTLGALSLSQPATAKTAAETRIVFVTHGQASDVYWSVVKAGLADAAKVMGSKVEYFAPEVWDVVKMQQMIDAAVASKPDGLVVSIPDAKALDPSVKKAVQAGIPVIVIDSGQDEVANVGARNYVGSASDFEAGKGAGQKMKEAGVTKAICINHEVGNVSLDDRCNGFKEGLGGSVEVVSVTMDPTETSTRVTGYLSAHPDVQGILTLGPTPAAPVLAALKKADLLGKIKFGTFDLSTEVLEAVAKGDMLFCIDAQPYLLGYLPVVDLTLNAVNGTMPTSTIYTGPAFITKEDAAMVVDLAKKGTR